MWNKKKEPRTLADVVLESHACIFIFFPSRLPSIVYFLFTQAVLLMQQHTGLLVSFLDGWMDLFSLSLFLPLMVVYLLVSRYSPLYSLYILG